MHHLRKSNLIYKLDEIQWFVAVFGKGITAGFRKVSIKQSSALNESTVIKMVLGSDMQKS